mgnify:CR=1 FL=1
MATRLKKLMILGGSRYALPVIKAAHDLGIYVITCDYLPDNIAHKYSDEYCNVSIIDKEKTLEAAKKLNIDGIMSFACDPGVITAAYVAEQMGLRYATGVDMITNMVKYSVGLPIDEIQQKPYNSCWAEIILHSDEPGVFKELWISDEIAENVVERDLWIEEGTTVGGFEAANEAIGTLLLRFDSQTRVEEVLGNQSKYVRVKLHDEHSWGVKNNYITFMPAIFTHLGRDAA